MTLPQLNPIILREIRSRLRRRRTYVGLVGYVGGLGICVWGFYALFYYINTTGSNTPTATGIQYGPVIGKSIFLGITFLLLIIFPFTAVSFAADAIAGERERQTFDMLRITTLTDQQIVWGKLGAVFIYIVLHLCLSLPIQALAFLFGGVALGEFLIAAVAVLVTGLTFGALGIYISSMARSARVATAMASALIMLYVYALPFIVWIMAIFSSFYSPVFFNNPSIPALLLYIYGGGFLASLNPLGAAILTSIAVAAGDGYFIYAVPMPTDSGSVTLWFISPWIIYVVCYLFFTVLLVMLTTRRIGKLNNFEAS